MKSKRKFTPEFKAKVAIEAIKGQKTLSELSSPFYGVERMEAEWCAEIAE